MSFEPIRPNQPKLDIMFNTIKVFFLNWNSHHSIFVFLGEDRWLCTLLLQEGYRVEYCAASDALTYAPESFHVSSSIV